MTIDIRVADENDLETLYSLYEAIGQKEDGYFERCLSEQGAGNREVLIASKDGKDAGFCMLNWKPRYSLYQKLGIPEIQDLKVVADMRRQGIARALILICEEKAKDNDCDQVGVSVGLTSDYGPAQRLYIAMGYMPDGNGVTYDRNPVRHAEMRPIDDDLCLMMMKDL